ncbi:glycosyl hydrolase [Marinimicrobium sp. C6131]|uniref:glycosyl hydrolase n=1 Tax=Marinimicrobium sp. C6131 TaxID=3022676 RepID=UPI00223E66BF|nr:glycosyl hydrolase [Marinimicrobium sp. C6131]UZJ44706.1 glycosyl hydrolase [Marinimicrobium sp. C6131]
MKIINNYLCLTIFLFLSLVASGSVAQTQFKTLNYLYSIQGQKTLGGMHNRQPNSNPNQYSQELYNITGVWPAFYSADFQFEPQEIASRQTMIDQVVTEWNNGAMINLMWHACNPAQSSPCYWDDSGVLSQMSDWEWDQLLTDGTPINQSWKAMMDDVAFYLQQLEDAGVEVLFRPLHEMNQDMFWWGGRPGSNGTAELYRLTHDYFTYSKGLTNLVWVWNLQDFSSLASDLDNYDPGGQYWDVLTLDMYWSDGQGYTQSKYNSILNKANGKPIGIGETEDLPSVALLEQQSQWTFFMGWSELTFSGNSNQKIQDIYWSDRVLTLGEMPGWDNVEGGSSGGNGSSSNEPTYIQAESYSNMSGIVTGPANDGEGDVSVGSIDTNDWLTYDGIEIPTTGSYTIAYRVASPNGGSLQLEEAGGSTIYGGLDIPATGGWSNWTTIYHTVNLSEGVNDFGVKAVQGGWNFNWFSIVAN